MRYTTITCDRCRAAITGPMSTRESAGELAGALPRIDLCGPCGRALLAWLRSAEALGSAAEDEGSSGPAWPVVPAAIAVAEVTSPGRRRRRVPGA